MSTTPPNKRRRIAGESKPGDLSQAPAPKPVSPGASLPKAPVRTDAPKPPKAPKLPKVAKAPAGPSPLRSVSAGAWALVGLTIAALVFGASGLIAGIRHHQGEDVGLVREEASDAAAAAAETIFTYQWNHLKRHLSDSQAVMTPKFAKKFKSISPALDALAPQRRIQVKAVSRNAATLECGEHCVANRATVLVFIDQARVADGIKQPTVFGNRIEMSMVKVDGEWLVANVKAL